MASRSDDLFELIQSLTKGEKKAFKRMAQIEGADNQYVQLFDFLNQCDMYDENQIRIAFPKIQQLHKIKNYLYKALMRSLRFIRKNTDTTIYAEIRNIELLLEKGLYQQVFKIIRRLKKRCQKEERFEDLLRVLRLELRLKKKRKMGKTDDIHTHQQQLLEIIENEFKYHELHKLFLGLIRKYFTAQNIPDANLLPQLLSHSLLQDKTQALSIRAERSFIQCYIIHSRLTQNSQALYHWSKKLVNLFKAHPFLRQEYIHSYLSGLLNLLNASIQLNQLEEFEAVQIILKKYENHSKDLALFILEYSATPILHYWFDVKKDVVKGKEFLEKLEKKLGKYEDKMSKEGLIMFYGNLSIHYFYLKDFEKVLKWLAKLHKVLGKNFREDVASFTRILNLVIHYELGNWQYIRSEAEATKKFLQRHHILFQAEKRLLNFFKNTSFDLLNPSQVKEKFEILKQHLKKENEEKTILKEFVNFFDWIDEKTQKA